MVLKLWRIITTQKYTLLWQKSWNYCCGKLRVTCHLSITKSSGRFHYLIYLRWWLPYQLCMFHLEDNFMKHVETGSTIWSTSLQWWQYYTFISCTILFTSHYNRRDTFIMSAVITWLINFFWMWCQKKTYYFSSLF